jgi:pimeloyl-ACP methyl ester carboxylesterase
MSQAIFFRNGEVVGVEVFYREAGRLDGPTLLLLHGSRPRADVHAAPPASRRSLPVLLLPMTGWRRPFTTQQLP